MQDFRKKGTFLFNEHEHKPDFRRILHFRRSQTPSFFAGNRKDQNELVSAEESGQEVFLLFVVLPSFFFIRRSKLQIDKIRG